MQRRFSTATRPVVLLGILLGGCDERDGPQTENGVSDSGSEVLPPVPEICDGSDDIRLYVADWAAGGGNTAVDFVMYAEGVRFLKIDGHCHYYVFDGEARRHRYWEPVREGDFTPEKLEEVVERLQVARWSTFEEEDLVWPDIHAAWERFDVAGEEHTCPYGCRGEVAVMLQEARELTAELAKVSEPVVPETLEVVALERESVPFSGLPFTVEWGAERPMEDLVSRGWAGDPSEGADRMGTFVQAADEPWFVEMTEAYRAAAPVGGPSAIGILDENDEVWHVLYVRTVVPSHPTSP